MRWLLALCSLVSACSKAPSLDTVEGVQALWGAQKANLSVVLVTSGEDAQGLFWNADQGRPLASTVKILVLAAYAGAVARGELSEDDAVAIDDWEDLFIGYDGGAHAQALADLERRGIVEDGKVPLREVAHAMIRFSDNAATDLLLLRLGRESMETAVQALKIAGLTVPHPLGGELLAMTAKVPANQVADAAWKRSGQLQRDREFRRAERARILPGLGLTEVENRTMLLAGNNQGTARAYATLMTRIASDALPGSEILRRELEWPMEFESNRATFKSLGTKGGSLPGILTSATYAQPKSGPTRVLAIFIHGLPDAAYRTLSHNYRHQDFERRLLTDPPFASAFFRQLDRGDSK